ncbi:interleukin-1 receptor-like 2 isoform X2 [Tamandua tetradactyla]|uniref:interleukin-1 receptor-like 2 isoform X2 n=1 Tax=Tamandua tetradactyla TaxID=48850 RepID=UPI00405420F6
MGARSWLLCRLSLALPLLVKADGCKDIGLQNETLEADQPFAFNCTYPLVTFREVNITWYKNSSQVPLCKNTQSRVHQEKSWVLFLPLTWEDSGIYQCVVKNVNSCHRIHVNLTVVKRYPCGASRKGLPSLSNEYKQILYLRKDYSLICYLNFPESYVLDSIKWYKDCLEVKGERFIFWETKLLVINASVEDRGNYVCQARLNHTGRQITAFNSISVSIERYENGGRVPKITYPKNNSIEVQLGAPLIVDCNITDSRENTNARSWKVNGTLVDDYYRESRRVREGVEKSVSFQQYKFYTVNITFLEVKMEDYGQPFVCHTGVSAAYIILELPAPDFRSYLIGGFIALTGVAVSAVLICSTFKIDIVLWYRSAFPSTGTVQDMKVYDAYVLYPKLPRESQSHDMDTLVLKILPEVLERQCGYKLFILGRDDFPGQAVANVIDENMRLCRRLIMIVVPESQGFALLKNMSEEQIALYNALIQDGTKVILIELERIEDYTNMPESVKYIKQKHGAIQWGGDFTEESQSAKTKFWKKVRYHMPPKRCPPSSSVQLLTHTSCNHTTDRREVNTGLITQ